MVSPSGTAAAEWTLATTSCLLLCLRFYVRRYIAKTGIQREDILLLAAQALFFCWISMDAFHISQGFMDNNRSYFDNFVDDIQGSDEKKIRLLKSVYASSVPYYICLWLIKFAILGLYFRIVPKGSKTRMLLWFTFGFTCVLGVAVILINVFLCEPISQNWSLEWDKACYSSTAMLPFVISVCGNFISDICIFIIPFPVLRGLKTLNRKQKIGLVVTFSLGAITIIVCVVRVVFIAMEGSISLAAVLTAIETFTALTVAQLPALRVLLKTRPFKRASKKSETSEDEENVTTTSDYDSRYTNNTSQFAPRGLPVRQEKYVNPLQPHGDTYVIHDQQLQQLPQSQEISPSQIPQTVSPPPHEQHPPIPQNPDAFRNDGFSLKDDEVYDEDFDDGDERVQMVALNGGRAVSPQNFNHHQMSNSQLSYYQNSAQQQQPYGAFPTASINNFRRAQPNSPPQISNHQGPSSTFGSHLSGDTDFVLHDEPQHHLAQSQQQQQQQQKRRDPFMPDYLHQPAPNAPPSSDVNPTI